MQIHINSILPLFLVICIIGCTTKSDQEIVTDVCNCVKTSEESSKKNCKSLFENEFQLLRMKQRQEKLNLIIGLIAKACPESLKYLDYNDEDSFEIKTKRDTFFDLKSCDNYFKTKEFFYIYGDNRVQVLMENGMSIEIEGNTTTELLAKRIGECGIELEFIKSNHPIKKKMSKKGDTYFYEILKEEKDYFLLQYESKGAFFNLKMYKDKKNYNE